MGLPTCRPLPRYHYDADSRGRCTNLSATPLTCVSCLPKPAACPVVRFFPLSFSLFFPPFSLLFLFFFFYFFCLFFFLFFSPVFLFILYLAHSLYQCLSFSQPPTRSFHPSPSVYVCPPRRRLHAGKCRVVVVSCHPALRQRSSRSCGGNDRSRILYDSVATGSPRQVTWILSFAFIVIATDRDK